MNIRSRALPTTLAAALCGLLAPSCVPEGSEAECSANKPCEERGTECNPTTNTCELVDFDDNSTDHSFQGGNFGPMPVPFFRGTVCAPRQVVSGGTIPFKVDMCVHPCMAQTTHKFKQLYHCTDNGCEALLVTWVTDSIGADCPLDVFARYDKSTCEYVTINATVGPIKFAEDVSVSDPVDIELPYLSNADIIEVHAGADGDRIREIVESYPANSARKITIDLLPTHPTAPDQCPGDGSVCTCTEIGF